MNSSEEEKNMKESSENIPHGFIQWKGTDVCMDVYCKCGYSFHVDGYFSYSVKCPNCQSSYECDSHIKLTELEK
jgi:hypothetical protein